MEAIEIKNLTKYYGKARGIIDVSFNVAEGKIFGFIGPNGAGKSTTIRTLLSLIYPTSGSAKIFGKDCVKYGPEIKKEIGYLPSEVFYYDKMNVSDLLKYSASFYKKDCSKRINELANLMELDLNKRIDDLSFGNKKKVGIVEGLLHEPKLIILDEPTGGLDPLMQQKFFNLLKEENKKGIGTFFGYVFNYSRFLFLCICIYNTVWVNSGYEFRHLNFIKGSTRENCGFSLNEARQPV
ncbi:MAG: ABC transporter ATP-binding protein [Desulfitobacteriaceae bacterium]